MQDAAAGRPSEALPPLCKPLKICPSLSDLRRSPLPPFVSPRAQEFPTLPPKPPRALPEADEDEDFSETKELLRQSPVQYAECDPWSKLAKGGGAAHPA